MYSRDGEIGRKRKRHSGDDLMPTTAEVWKRNRDVLWKSVIQIVSIPFFYFKLTFQTEELDHSYGTALFIIKVNKRDGATQNHYPGPIEDCPAYEYLNHLHGTTFRDIINVLDKEVDPKLLGNLYAVHAAKLRPYQRPGSTLDSYLT
jgi:hypothetical protein